MGLWAVAGVVTLPVLPEALVDLGPGASDTLDTSIVVVADTDVHKGYDEFRARGSWFFSGPGIVPDEAESLVRGTVFFPVPF